MELGWVAAQCLERSQPGLLACLLAVQPSFHGHSRDGSACSYGLRQSPRAGEDYLVLASEPGDIEKPDDAVLRGILALAEEGSARHLPCVDPKPSQWIHRPLCGSGTRVRALSVARAAISFWQQKLTFLL